MRMGSGHTDMELDRFTLDQIPRPLRVRVTVCSSAIQSASSQESSLLFIFL
jgi:hypothetical protein